MRLLIAEDDEILRSQLARTLEAAGYVVDVADNGIDARHLGQEAVFDAVILDLGLPRLDGLSVLRHWRETGRKMPVLILTARSEWHERVAGIDAGADDYLIKPFHPEELLARLRALIRRLGGQATDELRCGPLCLNLRSARVHVDGQSLTLTTQEFRVLTCLMQHTGQTVSPQTLTDHIYAMDGDRDSNTIQVFIARLRKKLPAGMIETLRGLGYRLNAPS